MNREQWRASLQSLGDTGSAAEIQSLAESMVNIASAPGRALGDCLDAEGGLRQVARICVTEAGPAVLEGLLNDPAYSAADDRAWRLERLLEAELQYRARVRSQLMGALQDKAWLSEDSTGAVMDPRPPRRRVCDEAYIAMRRLTHPEEDLVGFSIESEEFLHMPTEMKDQVIEQAISAHVWNLTPPDPNDADPDEEVGK